MSNFEELIRKIDVNFLGKIKLHFDKTNGRVSIQELGRNWERFLYTERKSTDAYRRKIERGLKESPFHRLLKWNKPKKNKKKIFPRYKSIENAFDDIEKIIYLLLLSYENVDLKVIPYKELKNIGLDIFPFKMIFSDKEDKDITVSFWDIIKTLSDGEQDSLSLRNNLLREYCLHGKLTLEGLRDFCSLYNDVFVARYARTNNIKLINIIRVEHQLKTNNDSAGKFIDMVLNTFLLRCSALGVKASIQELLEYKAFEKIGSHLISQLRSHENHLEKYMNIYADIEKLGDSIESNNLTMEMYLKSQ